MARVSRVAAALVALAVTATACSSSTGSDTSVTTVTGSPSDACVGLADRWVLLQQRVLDGLDASGELDPLEVNLAAAAMLEQARDAEARGCTAEVAVGSPLICERIDQLQPSSPTAEAMIADLAAVC